MVQVTPSGVQRVVPATRPLRLALVNDYDVVVDGLEAMFRDHPGRAVVVDPTAAASSRQPADIALLDTFSTSTWAVPTVLKQANAHRLVVYTGTIDEDLIKFWLWSGAAGVMSRSLSTEDLLVQLERVHDGETVVSDGKEPGQPGLAPATGDWPGRVQGLTIKEAEVVVLVTRGLTDREIAERVFVSLENVVSCTQSAFARMGVRTRSSAVAWGVDHGMLQRTERHLLSDET